MQKTYSIRHDGREVLIRIFLLGLLLSCSNQVIAQCYCSDFEIYPPAQGYHHTYDPVYNAEGQMVAYNFNFQFKCLGIPLDLFDEQDEYFYHVLYRKAGSDDPWQVSESSVWDNAQDFIVSVYDLAPGVEYEFRVNCPCPYPGCDAAAQVVSFLQGQALDNVTAAWTDTYCPFSTDWISAVKMDFINLENGSAHLSWQYGVLPPGPMEIRYRVNAPSFAWTSFQTTQSECVLSNLDFCYEYELEMRLPTPCSGDSKWLTFIASDCSASITGVSEITGNSATVSWAPNSEYPADNYTVSWGISPFELTSATTADLSYTVTGLSRNADYMVRVTPNCNSASLCPAPSQFWPFRTSCDIWENNDDFAAAKDIVPNQQVSASIGSATDVDYFAFTPDCEYVQVHIDHPLMLPSNNPFSESLTKLPNQLFDHNYLPVELFYFQDPAVPGYYERPYYAVVPGQKYFLKVSKPPFANWEADYQKACYQLSVRNCTRCFDNALNPIYGDEIVGSLPALQEYELYDFPFSNTEIDWNVEAGQAAIIPTGASGQIKLAFEQPGPVVLSATLTRCDGATMIYYKTINVSDPCYLSGSVSAPSGGGIQPLQSSNALFSSVYTVNLNLPPGTPFSWVKTAGQAVWNIDGTSIKIKQSSGDATFRLMLLEGGCAGQPRSYSFSLVGLAAAGDAAFTVSPNPVAGLLSIQPAPQRPAGEAGEYTVELFGALAGVCSHARGTWPDALLLDCTALPAGSYYLRITCGETVRIFPVTKI